MSSTVQTVITPPASTTASVNNLVPTKIAPPATPSPTFNSARIPRQNHIPMNRVMTTIEYKNMRFVVFDAPTESNLDLYLEELMTRKVCDIVRVCEPSYPTEPVEATGIHLHEMPFADGTIPPQQIITAFLNLCNSRFPGGILGANVYQGDASTNGVPAVGVHCVAGLGRAPILIAMALIESGMTSIEAVEYVRARRRGAFNSVQLNYLVESYKRIYAKKVSLVHGSSGSGNISGGVGGVTGGKKGGTIFGFGGGKKDAPAAVLVLGDASPRMSINGEDFSESALEAVSDGNGTFGAGMGAKGFMKSWFSKK
ncbi:Protein tyrosine phosphatase type IVA 1 [Physocladia obscura]|uniref:protein-tyrosine-phosphatase n=1 Tax=Physocladia obscura TaxID=109957 RepID=A0AAD5T798_9FUNG|nr:Protein tyrosine phosphatase type IVA 1 [Physocladia obscura]